MKKEKIKEIGIMIGVILVMSSPFFIGYFLTAYLVWILTDSSGTPIKSGCTQEVKRCDK